MADSIYDGTIILVLPDERPLSWNLFYSGLHWGERQREKDRVRLIVRAAIDPDRVTLFTHPVAIRVDAYFSGRPQDASNICAKLYEDALIGWLIKDDSPQYVASMTTASHKDKDYPRVVITLTPIGDPP